MKLLRAKNGYSFLFMHLTTLEWREICLNERKRINMMKRRGSRGDVTLFHEESEHCTFPTLTFLGNKVNHLEMGTVENSLLPAASSL
jgi:hypothetical protein